MTDSYEPKNKAQPISLTNIFRGFASMWEARKTRRAQIKALAAHTNLKPEILAKTLGLKTENVASAAGYLFGDPGGGVEWRDESGAKIAVARLLGCNTLVVSKGVGFRLEVVAAGDGSGLLKPTECCPKDGPRLIQINSLQDLHWALTKAAKSNPQIQPDELFAVLERPAPAVDHDQEPGR